MKVKYTQKQTTNMVWVADDGTEYAYRSNAIRHDAELMLNNNYRKITRDGIMLPDEDGYMDLYFIKDEDDWKFLYYTEWEQNTIGEEFTGAGWYGSIVHDGGDYPDTYEIIKIESYLHKQEVYLQELKHLTSAENVV